MLDESRNTAILCSPGSASVSISLDLETVQLRLIIPAKIPRYDDLDKETTTDNRNVHLPAKGNSITCCIRHQPIESHISHWDIVHSPVAV